MKPSFALNLTEDGITLLHRTSRGWMDVGNVAFDNPDLGAALEYLRSTALGLSPKGIATKLIIPDSQILYLTVQAEGPDEASRRAQIEAALDGRTPYALDELAYDWTADGCTVTVAVVARETLAEAEAFATEHRFNPVSFVARPETGFDKEPFFGASALAPSVLPTGETVEPDDAPITIVARDKTRPDAPAAITDGDTPQPAQTAAAEGAAEPVPEPVVEHMAQDPAPPEPAPPEPDLPEPDLPEPPVTPEPEPQPDLPPAEPEPQEPELPEPVPPVTEPDLPPLEIPPAPQPEPPSEVWMAEPVPAPAPPEPEPEPVRQRPSEQTPAPARMVQFDDLPRAPVKPSLTAEPIAEEPEAPMAVDVPQDDPAQDLPPPPPPAPRGASVLTGTLPPVDDDLPPPPSAAALMAFSSRRPAEGAPRPLGSAAAGPSDVVKAPRPGSAPAAVRATAAKPLVERPAAARPAPKFSYDDPAPPPPRMPGDPPTPATSVVGKASKGLRSLGTLVTSPTIPGTKKKKPTTNGAAPAFGQSTPATTAPGATLAAPMDASPMKASVAAASQSLARQKPVSPDAIAKGLSARNMPQRGKPKYLGLILTGILLLLLALVAAWSSFYLTRSDDPAAETQVAGFEGGFDDEAIADGQFPDAAEGLRADVQDPEDLAVDVDLTDAAPAPVIDAPADAPAETDLADAPAAAEPAPETGALDVAATANQPDPGNQDEIFLASMDAPPALSDPLVLPSPAAQGDAPPGDQMPPPPFGTVYQFDAQGRIVPTAEGIMTPDGVLLIAGKPARLPPPRPASLAALAPAPQPAPGDAGAEVVGDAATPVVAAPEAAGTELQPAQTFAADPSLAAARPRLRPEGLVPETAVDDDASLAPAEDSRFASLRPRLRPATVLAAGEAARQASEAASLAVQVAVAEAAAASAANANISPQAVAVSRVPAPRPRDLSRAVEAAVAAATRRPEPEVVAAAAPRSAAPADEADDEPEVASAAPRIPTKANVAKQATFVNAINLGKLNLIGVYGTQSKRYALVRQPNGRYRKVRVGDNIDGGRVQAITASEVRYQKGGRMLALAMPNG